MARYDETFVCTAIPAGVDGTKVRLAVVVSPRLTSDEPGDASLEQWPDAATWPAVQPTWKVTLTQGATSVTIDAAEVTGPYDLSAWQALFPTAMPVTPYVPGDRSTAPIASYPVAAVRDAVKELHVEALRSARTDFPTVEALQALPAFRAMKEAVIEPRPLDSDPRPDGELSLRDALGAVETWHGNRPGSLESPPVVTSVSPGEGPTYGGTPVTISGGNLAAATAVTFGGIPATDVEAVSRSVVTCTTPDVVMPGVRDVQVLGPGGTNEPSAAARFTFVAPPPPAITSIAPASTPADQQDPFLVRGTGFLGPIQVLMRQVDLPDAVEFACTGVALAPNGLEVTCTTPKIVVLDGNGNPIPDPPQIVFDVFVRTQGGTSAPGSHARFTFFKPAGPK